MADYYNNPDSARELGLLGPLMMRSARAVHARELARQMMTGGVPAYKRGGPVRKTGPAILHAGERVLNQKQNRRFETSRGKAARGSGRR